MKKITYISFLFFITSIFFLFMWFFWVKNTFAYEMKLWNLWYYDFWLYVNTSTWLYNNSFLWTKDIWTNYKNYIKLYDQLGVEKYSFMCNDPNSGSNPTGCPYNLIEFKEYYILFSYWVRVASYPTTYYIYRNALIVNKKDGTFNRIDFSLSSGSFSWEYPKYYVYYKDNIIYLFLWNKYYSLSDNWNYNLTEITNPWFTFFDFWPNTYNKYKLQYVNWFFYFYNRTDIKKEVVFSLNNYSVIDISLPNSFANKKSMNVISYDWKTYFSQESSTWDLQIIWCNSDLTGCSSFPNEYYLYFNYTQKKWYRITKTDYDAKNIKNLNWYYGFYDSDSSSYMKWYIKNDSFLYVDNSSLDVFWWGSSSWNTTCTENNSNCTCSYRDSYTFEYKKTFNYWSENILNYKSDYLEKSQYEIWFSYTPSNTWASNSSISVALYDFRSVKFNTSSTLDVLFEDSHFLFNSWSELKIKTAYIDKSYMVIGSTNPFSSFMLECKENQWKYFTLLNKDDLSKNEKIYDDDWAVRSANWEFKCWEYVNFEQKWNIAYIKVYWMGETYHISNIILFENTVTTSQKLICKKKDWTWYLDWEEYLPTDWDVNDFDNNVYWWPDYFHIESVINSNNLWNMDVSWSWMIISTMWTELNPIVAWDFWTGSCRMFWDNLQFLYYSNWQMTFNFSFWDFDNMFLDWLSFLWEKIIWVFTTPLQNMVSFVTILTPFWTSDKNYCIFGTVMTYTPHKMFIWTEFHNKMILIDYLVLFAYWAFLIWSLSLMHWIVWFIPPISQVEEKESIVNNWSTALTVRGNTSITSNSRHRNQKVLWEWKEYKPYGSYKIYR